MRFSHEEMKENLPAYIRAGVMPDEVKTHLETCSECRVDAIILNAVKDDPVPEPGGMFFETLPQKIRVSLKEKKSIVLRLVPAFALITVVVAAVLMYQVIRTPKVDNELLFSDPFAPQVYELNGLREDDIPSISETIEDEEVYVSEETPFQREFASLSAEEVEKFSEALNFINKNGGVI